MPILCTFPGRHGDLLWVLPTVRAISEGAYTAVDLCIAGEFAGLLPLLQQQPYLRHVWADPAWHLTPPDEWRAPYNGENQGTDVPILPQYTQIIHLGHRRWPAVSLPLALYQQLQREYPHIPCAPLDLDRPWITRNPPPAPINPIQVAVCFSEEWIELKMGVALALGQACPDLAFILVGPPSLGRRGEWQSVWARMPNMAMVACDWLEAARWLQGSAAVLTCNSGLWVLANAVNRSVVMLEPSEARHNPIFWLDHPRNRWVLGGDGKPTVDARHCADTLRKALAHA